MGGGGVRDLDNGGGGWLEPCVVFKYGMLLKADGLLY